MNRGVTAKKWAVVCISLTLLVAACRENLPYKSTYVPTVALAGVVQKGPFISGSAVMIQPLDSLFNPTGQAFAVAVTDDMGSFILQGVAEGTYIEMSAQGLYFNEVSGTISNSPLTLKAIAPVGGFVSSAGLKSNINVLTTLSRKRIIHLVNEEGKSFWNAREQAEAEILLLFNIPHQPTYEFSMMDISGPGEENGILLSISAILQGSLSVSQLSDLLSTISVDIESDGSVETTATIETLKVNALHLDLTAVREHLTDRYEALGMPVIIPPFEIFVDLLVRLHVKRTIPAHLETNVGAHLDKIVVYFNRNLDFTTVHLNNFVVTSPSGIVAGSIDYLADSFKIEFSPTAELVPETTYTVYMLNGIMDVNGDHLEDGYSFEFTTKNIDVSSNLVALYLLNGSTQDGSGNNQHGTGVNIQYGMDINGNAESACTFTGEGTYLELPNVLNITEMVWTYSIWFKLDDLESGIAPVLLGTRLTANAFWDAPLYIRSSIKAIATYNETAFGIPDVLSLNNWYHVAMVIDHGTIKMYLNGQLKASKSDFWSHQSNSGYEDFLGDAVGSYEYYTGKYYVSERFRGEEFPSWMKGSVDNIRFYRRALTKFEVKKLYDERM